VKYWVCITRNVPLKEHRQIVFSGFVDSEKETVEEVKQEILEHHKKKGLEKMRVTVAKAEGLEGRAERQ